MSIRSNWLILFFKSIFLLIAITTYHRLKRLINRNLFSRRSGGWKFKIKVLASLFFTEASPWVIDSYFLSAYSHGLSSVYVSLESLPILIRQIQLGSHLWPHLTLNTFLKALSPNTVTLGINASAHELWGDILQSITLIFRLVLSITERGVLKSPMVVMDLCFSLQFFQFSHRLLGSEICSS